MTSDTKTAPLAPGSLTRREVLGGTATLGVAGALMGAASTNAAPADAAAASDAQFAHEIRESCIFALAGEPLDEQRMKAMRDLLQTNLKEIELLRQFDPDEEEPVTRFRPW